MEMSRSLLKSMRVPGRFWGEAVRHSVYLLNKLPTKALGTQTPYEVWNGRKPHLGHLKVFGSVGHVKNTMPHLKKLEDRSTPMVYFGVEEESKAHRMFNPQTNKLVVSRDVVFEESKSWNWKSSNEFSEDADFTIEKQDHFITQIVGSADANDGGENSQHGSLAGSTSVVGSTSGGEAGEAVQEPGSVNTETEGHSVTVLEPTIETEEVN